MTENGEVWQLAVTDWPLDETRNSKLETRYKVAALHRLGSRHATRFEHGTLFTQVVAILLLKKVNPPKVKSQIWSFGNR